ncbi:MAG TPA: site-2 protease family protein [Gemmatales bacterium]|nr:site-2 protease family protein [Gemmatales bacterium]HMP58057.1 site-2 protease family protein [Gemmatales bacterium]
MNGDIYLGRLAGIPFRLHWSWFLALFLISWTLAVGFFPQTLPEHSGDRPFFWTLGVLAALGLFVSILLHELGHAFVARRFGIPVRGIRLFVFGGVAELGAEPKKPSHEILIALGGPIVTLLLIVLYNAGFSLILTVTSTNWNLGAGLLSIAGGSTVLAGAAALLFYLGLINTIVLIFNMLPAFPLDGGRVLRGIIWALTGNFLTSTRIAGGVGIGFAWLLFLAGFLMAFRGELLSGVWFFFLGMFLKNAAQSSIAYAQLQQLLGGVRVADMMRRQPVTVPGDLTLRQAAEDYFLRLPFKAYPVVADGRLLGILTLRALQETARDNWEVARVRDLLESQPPRPTVHPQEPVLQALQRMAAAGLSRVAVVENGQLVGLLCGRDVMALMEIRAGLALPREATADQEPPVESRG